MPIELRLVETAEPSGAYIHDRRSGEREPIAQSAAFPASRHEIDDLFSVTVAAALDCEVLAVCGPYPDNTVPLDLYGGLVADVKANGTPVDRRPLLAAPRQAPSRASRTWSRSTTGRSPATSPARSTPRSGCGRRWSGCRDAGAESVIVTRAGEPALALRDGRFAELVPPKFERGSREGCGDSMMGALAATIAAGRDWEDVLRTQRRRRRDQLPPRRPRHRLPRRDRRPGPARRTPPLSIDRFHLWAPMGTTKVETI